MTLDNTSLVLIVDNEESNFFNMPNIEKESVTFTIKTVKTIREARQFIQSSNPDLILSCMNLADGVAAELFNDCSAVPSFPLVLLIEADEETQAIEALKTGCLDYIVKTELDVIPFARLIARLQRQWKHVKKCNAMKRIEKERLKSKSAQVVKEQLGDSNLSIEQANESKANFLASMSHEIRTPMNGMMGLIDLLEFTSLDDKQREYIQTIQQSGNTLISVINDILDYSKVEAGMVELEHRSFNVFELIKKVVKPYEACSNNEVELNVVIGDELPEQLMGDSARLYQILSKLLNNAFKFTQKGCVTFKVELIQPSISQKNSDSVNISFSVKDTGIGIDSNAQRHLFQPFTQVDQSSSRAYGGTGLGLSICNALVKAMDGELTIDSHLGKGSCFTIKKCFDISVETNETNQLAIEDAIHNQIEQSQLVSNFSQLNVLLVEDNPVNQLVCKALLNKLGINAKVASSGSEAVDMVCSPGTLFDLIMMDCEMPGMDGYSATRIIRSWETHVQRSPTPIYACTAHVMSSSIKKCREAGMDDHIPKPINLEKLTQSFKKLQTNQHLVKNETISPM